MPRPLNATSTTRRPDPPPTSATPTAFTLSWHWLWTSRCTSTRSPTSWTGPAPVFTAPSLNSTPAATTDYTLITGTDHTLQLSVSPHTLDHDTRRRLRQLTNQRHGPTPGVAYLAYRLGHHDHPGAVDLARRAPDLLADAVAAGYITHTTGTDGHPTNIKLSPRVAFTLGIHTSLHDSFLLDPADQHQNPEADTT